MDTQPINCIFQMLLHSFPELHSTTFSMNIFRWHFLRIYFVEIFYDVKLQQHFLLIYINFDYIFYEHISTKFFMNLFRRHFEFISTKFYLNIFLRNKILQKFLWIYKIRHFLWTYFYEIFYDFISTTFWIYLAEIFYENISTK